MLNVICRGLVACSLAFAINLSVNGQPATSTFSKALCPDYGKLVRSLDVTYRRTMTSFDPKFVGNEDDVQIRFVMLDGLRYREVVNKRAVFPDCPRQFHIYDQESTYAISPAEVVATPGKLDSVDQSYYASESLFLELDDSSEGWMTGSGSLLDFPSCIDSSYSAPETVTLQGRVCVKLGNDKDTLWLDPSLGHAIVRREFTPNGSGQPLRFIYLYSNHGKIDGLWFPKKMTRHERYQPGEPCPPSGTEYQTIEIELLDLRVNQVEESFFDVELPNAAMFIGDGEVFRISEGGLTRLSDLQRHRSVKKASQPVASRSTMIPTLLIIVLAVVTTVVLRKGRRVSA
ncbi:MAG: hypothetical protein AAGA03_04110 [Planctomycetota bacterium]